MSLTSDQISKYRNIIATSTNELAVRTAKQKLKDAGIPEKEGAAAKPKAAASKKTEPSTPASAKMSQTEIDKYFRIYHESTNNLAKESAKKKLIAAGVLDEERNTGKGGDKEPSKQDNVAKVSSADKAGSKKRETRKKNAYASGKIWYNRIRKALKTKHKLNDAEISKAFDDEHVKRLIDEGMQNKWSAILTAKNIVSAMKKKQAAPDKEFNCDELIAKAKKAHAKREEIRRERANQPKKTPATKNKESLQKSAARVEKNITKRADSGKVSVTEIEKMIAVHEAAIKKLRDLLKKVKGKKMETGGVIELDNDDAAEFRQINEDHCGCDGHDMKKKGGSVTTTANDSDSIGDGWKHKKKMNSSGM